MEVKLNEKEAQVTLAFLNRTQLQGNEADTLVMLKQKIAQQLQPREQGVPAPVIKEKK